MEKEPQEGLDAITRFRAEMNVLKEEEVQSGTVHFVGPDRDPNLFHPEELTQEDLEIWQALQDDTITREEFKKYQEKVESADVSPSRKLFSGYMANKLTGVLGYRELKQEQEEQKGQ